MHRIMGELLHVGMNAWLCAFFGTCVGTCVLICIWVYMICACVS